MSQNKHEPELITYEDFADNYIALIIRTFFRAYFSHAQGMSEIELIIEHDIEAAYHDIDQPIRKMCRQAIKSAVQACDARVPYFKAHEQLCQRLNARISELLNADHEQRRMSKRFALNSLKHALD